MGKLTHTVKGPIASFRSADKAPIESLKLHFLPKQEGSGDPSPTNIRPITGWTGLNGFGANENLISLQDLTLANQSSDINTIRDGGDLKLTVIKNTTAWVGSSQEAYYNIPPALQGKEIFFTVDSITLETVNKDNQRATVVCEFRDANNAFITDPTVVSYTIDGSSNTLGRKVTIPTNAKIMRLYFRIAQNIANYGVYIGDYIIFHNFCIKYKDNHLGFKQQKATKLPITFPDGQTIYGGYVDPVAGEIWKTHYIAEINKVHQYVSDNQYFWYVTVGELNAIPNIKSENAGMFADRLKVVSGLGTGNPENQITFYANGIIRWKENGGMSLSEYEAYLEDNPITICYEMATPVLVSTFSSQDLKTFLDYNNFWSDANDITEVTYEFADRLSERKLIMDTPHIASTSGSVASFNTDLKAPIVDLKAHFTPVQEGSGDPSPSNIRPITGITRMNIEQTGKNLIDISTLAGDNKVWWKGSVISGYPNHCVTPKIPVKPGATYCLNRNSASQDYVCYFDKNGDYIDQQIWNNYNPSRTIPDGIYYVGITIGTAYLDNPVPQLELGSTATAYEEFVAGSKIPIEFPAMKNLVALNLSPYAAQQNPHATIIKQTADELEFTTHGDYTYEYVRLYYMIPAGTYTAKIYASTIDENDDYSPLLSLYVNGERVPFAGIRNGQSATFTLTEDTVVDMRFFGNLDDSSQRTVKFSNFQIERGSVATDYESRATIYGGYIDLVRGKIVATHGFFKRLYGPSNPSGVLGDYERHGYNTNIEFKPAIDLHDNGQGPYNGKTFCNVAFWGWDYFGDHLHYYIDGHQAYIMLPVGTDPNTEIEFCAELATPIEYDITPKILKTLKRTNNIWADTNGNIEVSYWTH